MSFKIVCVCVIIYTKAQFECDIPLKRGFWGLKKNIGIVLILAVVLTTLTGCSVENFFDIRSAMSPPAPSGEQVGIENSVKDYLDSDFKLSYLIIDDKYTSALKCKAGGVEYMVVFCETEDKFMKSHCVFFEKKSGGWVVKDDVVEGNFKFRSASVKDVNGDGIDEIVIEGSYVNNSNQKTYIYQIQKNGIVPIR